MNNEMITQVKSEIIKKINNNFAGAHVHLLNQPINKLFYLGHEVIEEPITQDITSPEKEDFVLNSLGIKVPFTKLNIKLKEKTLQVKDFQISCSTNRTIMKDLNDLNINNELQIVHILMNEFETTLNRNIIEAIDNNSEEFLKDSFDMVPLPLNSISIFINKLLSILGLNKILIKPNYKRVETKVPFDLKSPDDIHNKILLLANKIAGSSRLGPGNFVICNVALGSMLQNLQDVILEPLVNNINSSGQIYKMGNLGGRIDIFIDPYMSWDSDYFYVCRSEKNMHNNNAVGLNIGYMEDSINLSLIAEETMVPKFILSTRMYIEDISDKDRYVKIKYNPTLLQI